MMHLTYLLIPFNHPIRFKYWLVKPPLVLSEERYSLTGVPIIMKHAKKNVHLRINTVIPFLQKAQQLKTVI